MVTIWVKADAELTNLRNNYSRIRPQKGDHKSTLTMAQDLLSQTISEKNIDGTVITEPYRNYGDDIWVKDQMAQGALWVCREQAYQDIMQHPKGGSTRGKVKGVHIYICCAPPSVRLAEYEQILSALVSDARWCWRGLFNGTARKRMWGNTFSLQHWRS